MARSWPDWISHRFGLGPIRAATLDRRVPRTPFYYGDGATLVVLLGVLVVTGAFMTLTYTPSPDSAWLSVVYISTVQPMGWFIRGLHYWAGGFMTALLIVHVFRVMLIGGYKFPREGTWLVGVGLFVLVPVMSFTGYLLRWDERAIYATTLSLHMFSRVPLLGEYLVVYIQGGTELGAQTLTRLYAVHVVFTPLAILSLVAYHLYLVILHGISAPAESKGPILSEEQQKSLYKREAESEERGETFYPETVLGSLKMALPVFMLVALLALVVGASELEGEANLLEPTMPQGEWWYWWYSALIAVTPYYVAPALVVVVPLLMLAAMLLLPFLDRSPARGLRSRPRMAAFVVAAAAALVVLSTLRWQSPWTGWPQDEPPPVPNGVVLTAVEEEGRQLFHRYGCNSCHAVAGEGPIVGPDLAWAARLSPEQIQAQILHPPGDIPMPSYHERLTEPELERLAAFVYGAQQFPGPTIPRRPAWIRQAKAAP
jgi:ubiquinol-cytochrome c reductase cytochrome b subunit